MPLVDLPLDILLVILEFLDTSAVASFLAASPAIASTLSNVCHSFVASRPTLLHHAAVADNSALVILLLRHIPPSTTDPTRRQLTALHAAADAGATKAVQALLDHGAPLNTKYPGTGFACMPAIFFAAKNGHLDIVTLLSSHADTLPESRSLALEGAAGDGHLATVTALLKYRHSQEHLINSMCHAAAAGFLPVIKRILLLARKSRISVYSQDAGGSPPLHHAARNGRLEVIRFLLSQRGAGKWVNCQDWEGCTALHHAAEGGSKWAFKLLVEAGVDRGLVNEKNKAPSETSFYSRVDGWESCEFADEVEGPCEQLAD